MELLVARVDQLRARLAEEFEALVGAAGAGRPPVRCALSGGATALIFLGALKNAHVDWSRVSLFWCDERAVPPDHPDSNYGRASEMLLAPLGSAAPRAFRMPGEYPNLAEAACLYDEVLRQELDEGPLDLALLGVGEDGHVCALFPGHPALMADGRVVAIEDSPKPPRRRLSLTMPFLLQTRKIWLVAIGPRKINVLQAAIARTGQTTSLDLLVRHAKDVTVFTDQRLTAYDTARPKRHAPSPKPEAPGGRR